MSAPRTARIVAASALALTLGGTALARRSVDVKKSDFPAHKVQRATNRPELRRLTTCGGPIRDGHRADTIIIFADRVK
ncbi:hypothetical protein ABCR94_09840 [Streptomyces sp. 21So2-11]|uniref:hypothetical protein n=1 Tax=Streptomyces sp. 21So2-11 TaxID=3144408 RepID=UPI00321B19D2